MQEIELLVSTENGSIVTNIEVIKKHIAAGLEEYKHMVFTEETKKEAKATVADLRKLGVYDISGVFRIEDRTCNRQWICYRARKSK